MRLLRIVFVVLAITSASSSQALGQPAPAAPKTTGAEARKSAAIEEAKRLDAEVERLYGAGKYLEAMIPAAEVLSIRERELGPAHPAVAEALNNLSELCRETAQYARAEPLMLRALAIWERALGPDDPLVATALNNLALLYEAGGNHAKAEPLHLRALTIREKRLGPNDPLVASSLSNLSAVKRWLGDYSEAVRLNERAIQIRQKELGPENPELAFSIQGSALALEELGDYTQAQALYERALALREKALGPTHSRVRATLNNLARLHDRKGDYVTAEALHRRALAIAEESLGSEHPATATSLDGLAEHYRLQGDYAQAEPLYRRSLRIMLKTLAPEHPNVLTTLDNLALLSIETGDLDQAEPVLRQNLAIRLRTLSPEHPDVAATLHSIATLAMARGNFTEAEGHLRRAIQIRERALGPSHPDLALSLGDLARARLAAGDAPGARESAERAAQIQERQAEIVLATGSDRQKRAYMATLRDSTDAIVSLHTRFAPSLTSAARLSLNTILLRKGRVVDAMRGTQSALRAQLAQGEVELYDELEYKNSQIGALLLRGPGLLSLDTYREAIGAIEQRREALEAELSRKSAAFRQGHEAPSVDEVRAAIPEGAALLEIFRYRPFDPTAARRSMRFGPPRYVAYVIHRAGEASWADLGDARTMDAAVDSLRASLSNPDLAHDPGPQARRLGELVMSPIRNLLQGSRWIFVSSDGALNLAPFGALQDEDGRYLAESYLFSYLTSGRDLLRLREVVPPRQGGLILGDPHFDEGQSDSAPLPEGRSRGLASVNMSLIRFPPLPSTAREALSVQERLSGATIKLGSQATEGAVKAVHGPRILHIATHGFFLPESADYNDEQTENSVGSELSSREIAAALQRENPLLRSGLGLTGANRRESGASDDGVLTALEASALDLYGTKLVVLSACETGVGKASSGEGVYGLRRSLVIAGAETQVMSLWKVDTGITREMMVAYYDKLRAGAGRSEAMWQVQLEMMKNPKRAHPNLWASFIVSGNPDRLDGAPVSFNPVKVDPGPRGCACTVAGSQRWEGAAPASCLVGVWTLLFAARRRRARAVLSAR